MNATSETQTRSQGRWLGRTLLTIVLVSVVVASAYALTSTGSKKRDDGPRLTHTAKRGDLLVTVTENGTLESSENIEIKCKVRGQNTVIWVIENGTYVKPGDELVRLDTLFIEEQIAERTRYAFWSRSAAERSKADVARSKLAINEYEEGRFVSSLMGLEKDLAVAESTLLTNRNMLAHTERLFQQGYRSELDVEERRFAVTQAELNVSLKKTEINVLQEFTKAEQMETLKGNLEANEARFKADDERAYADNARRLRAVDEFEQCIVKADRAGLVIYPSAAAWKEAPDIAEGATVHKEQILLLMPNLEKMQVKIGIHESIIDRVKEGLEAKVKLGDKTLEAKVSNVATVTQPAGWWTGGVVKYDTIIKLPSIPNLKPGMSATVEVIMARHEDVLTVPVAAVIETEEAAYCWVETPEGAERKTVQLGDTDDIYIIIEEGLNEGDKVVLNPTAYLEEARTEVMKQFDKKRKEAEDTKEKDAVSPKK